MKWRNGQPIEATERELLSLYKGRCRDYYLTFAHFKLAFLHNGGKIIEDNENEKRKGGS